MKKLVFKLLVVSAVFITCSSDCLSQQTSTLNTPKSWKKINANGLFTFYLPQSARDTGFSGTEDFQKEYRIGKLRFMFVHNPMSRLSYDKREQVFGKGFQEHVIEIDGRKAYLFDYVQTEKRRKLYSTDLYIGDFPNGAVKLWMRADSWHRTDLEIAKKIFRSVEFLKP